MQQTEMRCFHGSGESKVELIDRSVFNKAQPLKTGFISNTFIQNGLV